MAKRTTPPVTYNPQPAYQQPQTLVYPPGTVQHVPVEDGPGIGMGAFDDSAAPGHAGADGDHAPDAGPVGQSGHGEHNTAQGGTSTRAHYPPFPVQGIPDDFREWIHSAVDNKGHDAKTNLRVQPAIARQINVIVKSGQFPYRTPGELMRHAIYNHLMWLASINHNIPNVMAQVDAINEMLCDEAMLQEQAQVLGNLLGVVERHLTMGDVPSAQRTVEKAMTNIDRMPPGAWRDSYRERFTQAFKNGGRRVATGGGAAQLQGPTGHRTGGGGDNE